MREPWRPLALAVVLSLTVGVGVAAAQTVIVKNAPPGSAVELVLNTATIATTTADASGDARLAVGLSANLKKAETDARIYVDVCEKSRRVLLVEPGMDAQPKEAACDRREIAGVFIVRSVATLVVDVARPTPVLWLRQGPAPVEWLKKATEGEAERPARDWRPSPTGLVVFGGGGIARVGNALTAFCGSADECSGKNTRGAYSAGAAFWITRFLAVEASYLESASVTASGGGEAFRFDSTLKARAVALSAKLAAPIGPVRIYGQAGGTYHRVTSKTTQTNDDVTTTVGGVTTTIKGGTQDFELRTAGWRWLFGGGIEVWVARPVALYAEGGRLGLKGSARDGGEGEIDDWAAFAVAGFRFRIGR